MTERPWSSPRPQAHSLAIEVTAFCNQRCDYCYNAWREDGGASVGTPERARLLARIDRVLDAVDFEHVTITGGEPLASHHLFPVLERLRARHVRAQMISNGALVTPELAARLARHRLLSVLVTLNGPDAALHDAQVGGAHFASTVQGIATLRAHRIPVEGCVVLSRRNVDRVAETLRFFLSLGVRKVALSRFSPAGYAVAFGRELVPSREDVGRALAAAAEVAR
ncbi:MAG TPA: radical SAM protein, partial [Polyangiaceae bacterium]|nr:radical SAM protein [Polyangiaceae bacterium]